MKKLILSIVLTGTVVFSLILATSPGCGSPDQVGGGGHSGHSDGGSAGTPTYNLDASVTGKGGSGGSGTSGVLPTDDANCGTQTNSTTKQPADVLLVLDRSGSMNNDIGQECQCTGSTGSGGVDPCSDPTTCKDRWTTLCSAVAATVSSTPDIHWGLKLYTTPNSRSCDVSSQVEVPIAANAGSQIESAIQSTKPENNTPTAAAIIAATAYLKTVNDPNNKVILLATDGQPNCKSGSRDSSTPDVDGTIAAIQAARQAGFLVYVVGIGPSVGNLNSFADAGGTTQYYPATSPTQLAAALASISTTVASCTFTLATKPPDVNNVAVYLDKAIVQQDPASAPANGWSFGANSQAIQLNGSTCERIKSGQASVVQVLFGCPGQLPPKNIP
jgi:hypothetical protein